MTSRRGFLAGILAAAAAPAIVHNPMRLWVPRRELVIEPGLYSFPFGGDPAQLLEIHAQFRRGMLDNVGLAANPRMVVGRRGLIIEPEPELVRFAVEWRLTGVALS
jgi:hypothetical protein